MSSNDDDDRTRVIAAVHAEESHRTRLDSSGIATTIELLGYFIKHGGSEKTLNALKKDAKIKVHQDTVLATVIAKAFAALAGFDVRQAYRRVWISRHSKVLQHLTAQDIKTEEAARAYFAQIGNWTRVLALAMGEPDPEEIVEDDLDEPDVEDGDGGEADDEAGEGEARPRSGKTEVVLPDAALSLAQADLADQFPRVGKILEALMAIPSAERWQELIRMMTLLEDDLRQAEEFAKARPAVPARPTAKSTPTKAVPKPRLRRVGKKPAPAVEDVLPEMLRADEATEVTV